MKSFKSLDDVDYLILFLGDDNHLLLENNVVMPHYSYAEYAYIISDKGEVLKNILDRDPNFILQGISRFYILTKTPYIPRDKNCILCILHCRFRTGFLPQSGTSPAVLNIGFSAVTYCV